MIRAMLVSPSPVVFGWTLPPWAQSQTMPAALPSTIVQTTASPAPRLSARADASATGADVRSARKLASVMEAP